MKPKLILEVWLWFDVIFKGYSEKNNKLQTPNSSENPKFNQIAI